MEYQHKKALQELDAEKEHASNEEAILKLLDEAEPLHVFFTTLYKFRKVAESSEMLIGFL